MAPKKRRKTKKNEGSDGAQKLGAGAHRVGSWKGEGAKGGAQKGGSPNPEKVEAERVGGGRMVRGQNFALFSLSRSIFDSFSLSGVFSWNCGHGSRLWTTQNAQFGWSIE